MSAQELSDVTLALVDTDVLSCWESKVKLGLECSLLLKHSKGKVTTTLQFSAPTASSSDSQAVKKKKTKISAKQKRTKMNAKKLEALLAYQKRLVEERGLPPSRLMLQHAAVETSSAAAAPVPEHGQVSETDFKCEQCDFSSKSKRGLKTHTSRIHKDNQKPGVKHGEPEDLRDKEQEKSLNVSQRSQSRDQSFANAVLSSTLKESVNDSVNDNCTVKCDQPGCHQGFPHEEALKVHLCDKHGLPKKCPGCDLVFSCYGALGRCARAHLGIK